MAANNNEPKLPIPIIRVNDFEVVDGNNGKQRDENSAKRAKRLAAKHNLRRCGRTGRETLGGNHIRQELYKITEDRSRMIIESAQLRDELSGEGHGVEDISDVLVREPSRFLTAHRTFTTVSSLASKRSFVVAFPSSYYDREACLNFYRIPETKTSPTCKPQSQSHSKYAVDGTMSDMDDTMSDTGSESSISSVQTIEYDFNNSYRCLSWRENDQVLVAAPHRIPAPHDGKQMLHPATAECMKNKSQGPHGSRGIQPRPKHILCSFFNELAQPPPAAFDPITGGLQRKWLHMVRPQFFCSKGELQEYVIHKNKPPGMSQCLWLWLCGRDSKLPLHGPDPLALKVAIESAELFNRAGNYPQTYRTQTIRGLINAHGLDFDVQRSSSEDRSIYERPLWNRMLRAEKRQEEEKQSWEPRRVKRNEVEAYTPEPCSSPMLLASSTLFARPAAQNSTPEKSKNDALIKTDLFRAAIPEAQQQILANAICSKLQGTAHANQTSTITASLLELGTDRVCQLLEDNVQFWCKVVDIVDRPRSTSTAIAPCVLSSGPPATPTVQEREPPTHAPPPSAQGDNNTTLEVLSPTSQDHTPLLFEQIKPLSV